MNINCKKISFGKSLIDEIKLKVKSLKEDNNLKDEIIKDKVFQILEKEGIVLYFPLDDNINGMYVKKYINGKEEKIIYINTKKLYYDQIFAAAHELGHIYGTDEIANESFSIEEITDRFAAELLLPDRKIYVACEKIFQKHKLSVRELLNFLGDMMIEYKVSFDTIIRRLVELNIANENLFNNLFKKVSKPQCFEYINSYLNEHNTDINVRTEKKYISNLKNILKMSQESGKSYILANKLLKIFDLKSIYNPNFESELDCEDKK